MRLILWLLIAAPAFAKTINITNTDDYTKMEAAVAGDEVVIAPGTYKFRVNWENAGTPGSPIIVRAQDPNSRPVWDLDGIPVGTAPGSYNGGDKGRGCWQFRGGYYRIDGIVFKNCRDSSSAGLRIVNVPSIEVRHSLFVGNTNGLTGAGDGTVIEYCEFDGNGLPQTPAAHQIYIYGGTLAVRWSYFHDSPAGQNFHVRARDATLEYNFFTRPGSYMGDLMSCEYFCGGAGSAPSITQKMLLRGNVIEQSMPDNHSQLIALYNDGPAGNADGTGNVNRMEITLLYNTIIGQKGVNNAVVHHLNDSGISTAAHLSNNVITDFKSLNEIADGTLGNFSVDGNNNWATTGSDATGLTGTLNGASPMFDSGYLPAVGSPLIGAAMSLGAQNPNSQYQAVAMALARATANDIGAYESGTLLALPDLSSSSPMDLPYPADLAGVDFAASDLSGVDLANQPPAKMKDAGCGCDVSSSEPPGLGWILLLLVYLTRAMWRSPEKVCASTRPSPLP